MEWGTMVFFRPDFQRKTTVTFLFGFIGPIAVGDFLRCSKNGNFLRSTNFSPNKSYGFSQKTSSFGKRDQHHGASIDLQTECPDCLPPSHTGCGGRRMPCRSNKWGAFGSAPRRKQENAQNLMGLRVFSWLCPWWRAQFHDFHIFSWNVNTKECT